MEPNRGLEDTDRLLKKWSCYESDSIRAANDADRFIKFIEEMMADTERRDAVLDNLKTSPQQIQENFAGAKRVRAALTAEFPEAIKEGK